MRVLAFICAIFALVLMTTTTQAQVAKRRGGFQVTSKIGPWFFLRNTFDDGSSICWASGLSYGRRRPVFQFYTTKYADEPLSGFRFDLDRPSKPAETVELVVGGKSFTLKNPADSEGNSFYPTSFKDALLMEQLILEAEKSKRKYFLVNENGGRTHKFDARLVSKALAKLERDCDFQKFSAR